MIIRPITKKSDILLTNYNGVKLSKITSRLGKVFREESKKKFYDKFFKKK